MTLEINKDVPMHIEITSTTAQQQVHDELRQLRSGDRVHCDNVGQFLFCKRLLEQWRWSDILLLMMDDQKQVLKQFKYKPPRTSASARGALSEKLHAHPALTMHVPPKCIGTTRLNVTALNVTVRSLANPCTVALAQGM